MLRLLLMHDADSVYIPQMPRLMLPGAAQRRCWPREDSRDGPGLAGGGVTSISFT